jgi:hypothetical protein
MQYRGNGENTYNDWENIAFQKEHGNMSPGGKKNGKAKIAVEC